MVDLAYTAHTCNATFVVRGTHSHLTPRWITSLPPKKLKGSIFGSGTERSLLDECVTTSELQRRIDDEAFHLNEVTMRDKYDEDNDDELRTVITFIFRTDEADVVMTEGLQAFTKMAKLQWSSAEVFEDKASRLVNYHFSSLQRSFDDVQEYFGLPVFTL